PCSRRGNGRVFSSAAPSTAGRSYRPRLSARQGSGCRSPRRSWPSENRLSLASAGCFELEKPSPAVGDRLLDYRRLIHAESGQLSLGGLHGSRLDRLSDFTPVGFPSGPR